MKGKYVFTVIIDTCEHKSPTPRYFSWRIYYSPGLPRTSNIFPDKKHYFFKKQRFLFSVFSYLELIHYVFVISRKRTRTLLLLRDFKYYNSWSDTFENDRHLCRCDERIRRDSYLNILRKTQHSLYYVVLLPCPQALSSLSPLSLGEKPWLRQVTWSQNLDSKQIFWVGGVAECVVCCCDKLCRFQILRQ